MKQSRRQSVHRKLLGMTSNTYGVFETGEILSLMLTNMTKRIQNKYHRNLSDNVYVFAQTGNSNSNMAAWLYLNSSWSKIQGLLLEFRSSMLYCLSSQFQITNSD